MQRIGMPVPQAGRTDIGETSGRVGASAGAFPGGARVPATLMAGVIMLCVAIMAGTLWAALDRPWLGVEFVVRSDGSVVIGRLSDDGPARDMPLGAVVKRIFAPGTSLSSTVTAFDLIPEPDFMPSYAELDRFMMRQGGLARILEAPRVGLELGDGTIFMADPVSRPLTSLPGAFWIQFITGIGSLLIAGWVFAIRPRDGPPRLFIFSGIAMIASAHAAALYSTRELALPEALFQFLSLCNFAGALGFGGAAVALFMIYPKTLASPRVVLLVPLFGLAALAVERLRLIEVQNVARYLPMAVDMVAIVFVVAAQWYATRRDAADRAVLRWLGLTITVGAGCFILAIATPLLLGAQPAISQGYAFGFFLLIYVGLAFGLRRYRLFAIGEWSFRVLFFAGASLALLVLDAGMIYLLHLGPEPALGFSLLVVCFLYLPLRDWIWRHTVGRPRMAESELFRAVVGVAFDPRPGERAARWRALLRNLFDPLELEASPVPVRRAWIDMDGTTML
ncbi:MAG: sensor histidine kinase, partial [Zavarzinia sp.]|nr:sensor histidine kinase [Zavarzinia sp.]